jgi:hypothetical protein
VLGVLAYLGFDVVVLWTAFLAIHAHPFPGFATVAMAYIVGALGGSIPLPASIGTIGGMAGMQILYGVGHNVAIAVAPPSNRAARAADRRRDRVRDPSPSRWADHPCTRQAGLTANIGHGSV